MNALRAIWELTDKSSENIYVCKYIDHVIKLENPDYLVVFFLNRVLQDAKTESVKTAIFNMISVVEAEYGV